MDQIGYSAIDVKKKKEVWFTGDEYGVCPGFPNFIPLPNLIQVWNAKLGETYEGYKIVVRYIENGPTESIDVFDDKVVVTRPLGE